MQIVSKHCEQALAPCSSGDRQMTLSSRPIIARSRHIRGLYINAGHGMLGWSLALGSARRVVGVVAQRQEVR
jgi:D-amino-acid dehydrogenase